MGPLVDIAVVVVESIHRKREEGLSPVAAALQGTQAVALPAFSAMLTTNAVLLPVALLTGLAKKLFVPLAITVATGMVAGFLVSMIVTPVAARFLFGKMSHGEIAAKAAKFVEGFRNAYLRALEAVLPWRRFYIGAVLVMVVAAVAWMTRLPSTFFPEIDESIETVYVRLAPGTSLEDAAKQVEAMAKLLVEELPKGTVELVLTNMGTPNNARSAMTSPNTGPHTGYIALSLADPEKRKLDQREIADEMRKILVEHYPGVEFLQAPGGLVANVFANGYLSPLVVEVRGEKLDKLLEDSDAVAEVARQVPGVRDVRVSLENDYPELRVDLKREEAGLVGVSARAAGQAALEATLGNINTPGVWVDSKNGQSYYVVTGYEPKSVQDPAALAELPARAAPGAKVVQLGAYAKVRRALGPIAVERNALRRVAHVLMQTERRDVGTAAADLESRLEKNAATQKLDWHFVGQVELMRTTFGDLGGAIVLALMLVFMIMASQFKSFTLPVVMLLTIPVSVIGIAVALMIAGMGFSVTALMGVLMVVGIAVSNGILLVDASQRALATGLDRTQAVLQGARERFVPILMTSLATVIGLLPVALGLEHGAEANRPLALAVVGGLTSSTTLALFLVPSLFVMIARVPKKADDLEAAATEQAKHAGAH
jgi:multidrug efflux pump subunit AcrB